MPNIIPALAVADIAASLRFYTETLGFQSEGTLADENGVLVHASASLGDSHVMFGRIDPSQPHDQPPLGRGVALYTTVADDVDIDALYARAKASGAPVLSEPTDQFWGHRDWGVTDPDGYVVIVSKVVRQVTEEEMREAALATAPAD
jgi:uncharacterized glyoxalase superfamily protein PhnB